MPRNFTLTQNVVARFETIGDLALPYVIEDCDEIERYAAVIKLHEGWHLKQDLEFVLLWHADPKEMSDLQDHIMALRRSMDQPLFTLGYRWVDTKNGKAIKVLALKVRN